MAKYYGKFVRVVLIMFLASPAYSTTSTSSNSFSQTLPAKSSSHFVTVNGVRLHYIEAGSGPLVILLHGWPETSYSWRNTISVLSKNYHVVAPDLRGLGQSEHTQSGYDKKTLATDIKVLVEYLGEKQAIIIGHDMGGKAAYVMAHLYPQMVSKLVLVDCFIPGTENADALHGGSWHYGFHMAKDFPEMLTKGREKEYISAMIQLMSYKKDAISEESIDEYVKYYSTPGGMTAGFNYYRALKEDAALVETFKGEKLTMPVLAITGAHSTGDKLSKALARETLSLQSIIVEDSGHFVAEESPKKFNSSVMDFLKNKNQPSSYCITENKCISYTDSEKGKPLVLIHAFPTDKSLWQPQQTELQKNFRVITLDLWGFGQSSPVDGQAISMTEYADETKALLDKLNITQAIIGGESMGGYIALAFLEKYPDAVSGLILSDTQSIPDSTEAKVKREETAVNILKHGTASLIDGFMPKALTANASEKMRTFLQNILESQSATAEASALRGIALRKDTSHVLAQTNIPVLIITGQQDTLILPEQSQYMHKLAKNSTLVTIANAAHLSSLEQPEQWNKAIIDMAF